MKISAALFPLLVLAVLAGCVAPAVSTSAGRVVVPAPTVGRSPSWTPTAEELAIAEKNLAFLLANPDERVFGLGQNLPPHPFSAYWVRYTAAGPLDNKYLIGVAALPGTVAQDEFLAPATSDLRAVELGAAPGNFQFIYNLKLQRVTEIRFNK
jgi:hypothetical protein